MKKRKMKQILAAQTAEIKQVRYEMVAYQRILIRVGNKMDAFALTNSKTLRGLKIPGKMHNEEERV